MEIVSGEPFLELEELLVVSCFHQFMDQGGRGVFVDNDDERSDWGNIELTPDVYHNECK